MSRKCIACGEPATHKLGSDPDIRGVPVCKEHIQDVQIDLMMLLLDGFEAHNEKWFADKYNLKTRDND